MCTTSRCVWRGGLPIKFRSLRHSRCLVCALMGRCCLACSILGACTGGEFGRGILGCRRSRCWLLFDTATCRRGLLWLLKDVFSTDSRGLSILYFTIFDVDLSTRYIWDCALQTSQIKNSTPRQSPTYLEESLGVNSGAVALSTAVVDADVEAEAAFCSAALEFYQFHQCQCMVVSRPRLTKWNACGMTHSFSLAPIMPFSEFAATKRSSRTVFSSLTIRARISIKPLPIKLTAG